MRKIAILFAYLTVQIANAANLDSLPFFPKRKIGVGMAGGYLRAVGYAQPWANISKTVDLVYVVEPRVIYRPFGNVYVGAGLRYGRFLHNGVQNAPDWKGYGVFTWIYSRKASDKIQFLCKKSPYRFRMFFFASAYTQNLAYDPSKLPYNYVHFDKPKALEYSLGSGISFRIWRGLQISASITPSFWPATGKFFWKSTNLTVEYLFISEKK